MIKIVTPLLLAVSLHFNASAQSTSNSVGCLRAVYQLAYKYDSAVATPKQVRMTLRISNGISQFRSTGMQLMDSTYVALAGTADKERLQKSMQVTRKGGKNEFRYTILKEPAKNLVAYHDGINSEDFQYLEKPPLFDWRITPAKKTIAGHECQQAFTTFGGRTWEAWFARDVPVSDGPYKFYGLPGLILQVGDTHENYVFSVLCLDTTPQPFDVAAATGAPYEAKASAPVISKAKFRQAKLNDDFTFMERMLASGNKVPENMQKDYYAELKRRNNPLERK